MKPEAQTPLDNALRYAKRGFQVFPILPVRQNAEGSDGKTPYPGTHGHLDASAHPEELTGLFADRDDCNIGLSCSESGLAVVDIDLDLDTPQGSEAFDVFVEKHPLPATYTQKTPGGGRHFFYKVRNGALYKGKLPSVPGQNVSAGEIKHNGYVLLAPSVAKSKRRSQPGAYVVIDDLPIADAPSWLEREKTVASPPNLNPLATSGLYSDLSVALKLMGLKHNLLSGYEDFRDLAFALKNAALAVGQVDEVRAEFVAFAMRWELRDETEDSVEQSIRKTYDWAEYRSDGKQIGTAFWILKKLPDLTLSDVEPCLLTQPTKADIESITFTGLAGRIAEILRQASDRELSVFPEAAALMAMSALAAPIYIMRGPQGKVTLNLYGLLLGGTGSGKEAARKAADMVLGAALRGDERLDGAASDRALHRALADQRGALTVTIDEGGLQLGAIKKGQQSHQRALLTLAMSLWGLGLGQLKPHKYADAKNNIAGVKDPRLTLMMMSTPAAMQSATAAEDSESGQLNRFLVFEEPGYPPLRTGPVDRDLLIDPPTDIVEACQRFPPRDAVSRMVTARSGLPEEHIVEMSAAAQAIVEDFRTGEVETARMKGGLTSESWARAVEQVLRVSGLLALSDAALGGDMGRVFCGETHVAIAIKLVKRAILGTEVFAKNATKNETEKTKDKVLAAIMKYAAADGFARARDVKKDVLRGIQKRDREDVLKAMIEDGEIILQGRTPPQGGPVGEYYAIAQDIGSGPP